MTELTTAYILHVFLVCGCSGFCLRVGSGSESHVPLPRKAKSGISWTMCVVLPRQDAFWLSWALRVCTALLMCAQCAWTRNGKGEEKTRACVLKRCCDESTYANDLILDLCKSVPSTVPFRLRRQRQDDLAELAFRPAAQVKGMVKGKKSACVRAPMLSSNCPPVRPNMHILPENHAGFRV